MDPDPDLDLHHNNAVYTTSYYGQQINRYSLRVFMLGGR